MHTKGHPRNSLFGMYWNPANVTLVIMLTLLFLIFLLLFLTLTAQPAQGQTFQVLHNFTGGADGAASAAGVTLDAVGNLYGTASAGGYFGQYCVEGCGLVFKLSSNHGAWTESVLHAFAYPSPVDGAVPLSGVVFGSDSQLYGATSWGGSMADGAFFSLGPGATVCETALCGWTETMLTSLVPEFCEGEGIGYGDVAFDGTGAVYATTLNGGLGDVGAIVKAVPPSNGGWICASVYSFNWSTDGGQTEAGVIFVGNLMYGVTTQGPNGYYGAVYVMEAYEYLQVLHYFENGADGANPFASLTSDASGNVYGTTESGGSRGGGTVFEVTPSGAFSVLYSFADGAYSHGPVSFDRAGSLYGTLSWGGANRLGSVYKLAPSASGWTYTSLHDFSGSDGSHPYGKVSFDANGNLYGTASSGGAYGHGVVWKITP